MSFRQNYWTNYGWSDLFKAWRFSSVYLPSILVSKLLQCFPNVWQFLFNKLDQKGSNFLKVAIVHVIMPRAYEYPIIRLKYVIVADVINNYCFCKLTSQQRQVFYQKWSILWAMLSVKTVLYQFVLIYFINYLVSIILHRCSKYD